MTTKKGGYDVKFVKADAENIQCSICLFTLKEPMQAEECGHRFCKSCVEDLQKGDNGNPLCPEDRSEMVLFRDKGRQREILEYVVYCSYFDDGCSWTKELRHLEDHLDEECQFELLQCTNTGCVDQIQRRNLSKHGDEECQYRIITCGFCSIKYAFHLDTDHLGFCTEFPLCCFNCAEDGIPRSKLESHISDECTKIPHPCHFASLGCEEKVIAEDILKHSSESAEYHLSLALNRINKQEGKIKYQNGEIKAQNDEIQSLKLAQEKIVQPLAKIESKKTPEVSTPFSDEHIWKILNFS